MQTQIAGTSTLKRRPVVRWIDVSTETRRIELPLRLTLSAPAISTGERRVALICNDCGWPVDSGLNDVMTEQDAVELFEWLGRHAIHYGCGVLN